MRLRSGARVLRQFARETGNPDLSEVTTESVAAFLRGRGKLSATWKTKRAVLSGLYRFAIAHGYATDSVLPEQTLKTGQLGRLDAPLAHPAPQLVGVDPVGQGDSGDRGARLITGVDQGLLECFGVGATGTAGLGDVHVSVHFYA